MQTLEFTRTLAAINRDLKVAELAEMIRPWVSGSNATINESTKNRFSELLFDSNAAYQRLIADQSARKVLTMLNVAAFYEPSRLRNFLAVVSAAQNTGQIYGTPAHALQFISFLELLRSFQAFQKATIQLLELGKIGAPSATSGLCELELVEYTDEEGIAPKRVQAFVVGITQLHSHLTRIHGLTSDNISFKYFDSGSGVLVGLKCAKVIAESIGTLFEQFWDKIIYLRFGTFDKKIEALSKGLTVVETIHASVEKNVITAEEGENLKLRIFREVEKLTGIGVTVPITVDADASKRQLLTEVRNTKLLSDGGSSEQSCEEVAAQASSA